MNKHVLSLMEKIKEVNGNVTGSVVNEYDLRNTPCGLLRLNTKGGYLFDVSFNSSNGDLISDKYNWTYLSAIESDNIIDFLLEVLSLELELQKSKTLNV